MDTEKKIPTTRPVHYEDDFDFILHLYSVLVDSEGNVTRREELPFPKYDFTATFRTGCTARSFTASCIGGVCTNCYNDAGRVHVVADNHGLGPGPLRCKLTCELPDEVFPDGMRRMVVPEELNIELTKEKGAYPSTIEAEVLLPYIKGDKGDAFTYSDFTAEEIAELQRPATEAAQRADESEAVRQANEEQRIKSETARSTAYKEIAAEESRRVKAEQARAGAEDLRKESEERRESEESLRRSAEQNRTEQEQSRQDAEVLRQAAETRRGEAEAARQDAFEEAQTQRAQTFLQAEQERDAEFAGYSDAIEEAKRKVFIDLVTGLGAEYDPENAPDAEHPFLLNELWLTWGEMVDIYNVYYKGVDQREALANTNIKTNLRVTSQWTGDITRFAQNNTSLIVANISMAVSPGKIATSFYGCVHLRKVIGGIRHQGGKIDEWVFMNCRELEYVEIKQLRDDMNLQWSPLITSECLQYIVGNAANGTNTITITVHPDVYAKLTGDTDNAAAAALDAEEAAEWQAVLTAAAAKNISFATV